MGYEPAPLKLENSASGAPPVAVDTTIECLASLVGLMSRFLTRLAGVEPFKQANMGLSEWLGLIAIRAAEGANNKQLAHALNVTGQRAAQISEALRTAGMIAVVQSPRDSRKNVMTTTEHGRAELAKLNEALLSLVAGSLKEKSRVLNRTLRGLRVLMQIVLPPNATRPRVDSLGQSITEKP